MKLSYKFIQAKIVYAYLVQLHIQKQKHTFKYSFYNDLQIFFSQFDLYVFYGLGINKYMKMFNGNKKSGLRIAMWNCRRGLVDHANRPTDKYTELLNFIQAKSPHLFCIIESDLHSIKII